MKVSTVIFDFGGVIAEEGWAKGVRIIAEKCGFEPEEFFNACVETIGETGFVIGKTDEHGYWKAVKRRYDIPFSVEELKEEILPRFEIRPYILELADRLRENYRTVILSDQTHWLDELNGRHVFFSHFDIVFNSYHDGNSKSSVSYFTETCTKLDIFPQEAVFIDDNKGNIERARSIGMNAILYETYEQVAAELGEFVNL
jgi:putative hydrolase of the HAD superfamily